MTTKEKYHRLYHLEREWYWVFNSDIPDLRRFEKREIVMDEIRLFSAFMHSDVQTSLGWRDGQMSGWVNDARRMRWNQLREPTQPETCPVCHETLAFVGNDDDGQPVTECSTLDCVAIENMEMEIW